MKKYGYSYQNKALDRLEKSEAITSTQKSIWKFIVAFGRVSRLVGVQVDFIIDKQDGIINFANRVDSQESKIALVSIANEVKSQIQNIGIQIAKHSDIQKLDFGYQHSKYNYNKQKEAYGLQTVDRGVTQLQKSGFQFGENINYGDQISNGVSVQVGKTIIGNQKGNYGIQFAKTIEGREVLKTGIQVFQYIKGQQSLGKGYSIKKSSN